jgi:hypothetical protein
MIAVMAELSSVHYCRNAANLLDRIIPISPKSSTVNINLQARVRSIETLSCNSSAAYRRSDTTRIKIAGKPYEPIV